MTTQLLEKQRLIKQAMGCAKRIEALLISVDQRLEAKSKKAA